MDFKLVLDRLLNSSEPAIRFKTLVNVLGENPNGVAAAKLRKEVKKSNLAAKLLQNMEAGGRIRSYQGVYDKWQGAHWVLATLADIGYPIKDPSLIKAKEDVLSCWLAPRYFNEFEANKKHDAYKKDAIPIMQGRHRTCASQQGYALYFLIKLGLEDERVHKLSERLVHWQWPDGGWNCDKEPRASTSTFIHTALSLRGLALYNKEYGNTGSNRAASAAAEFLLKRRLFKRASSGTVVHPEFMSLHYPLYWHYDILGSLKIMAESGHLKDPRCRDAINILLEKQLPGGGWPAENKYYKTSSELKLGNDYVDWGGIGKNKINEWVTVDALYVLKSENILK